MRTWKTVAGTLALLLLPAVAAAGQTVIEALPPLPTVEPLSAEDAAPVRPSPCQK